MIRLAIIGLGHIGRIHIAALTQSKGFALVAGCDNDSALAAVLPPGIPFYPSHHNMLAAGDYDTVMVATPNRIHNAIACDVLSAGYNVIVEKPAATCPAELQHLEQLAAARGRHVYYAFHAAAAFEVDALVAHLGDNSRSYGPLTGFHCRFYDPYIHPSGSLLTQAQSLDDCWSDSGVNALSVLDRVLPVDAFSLAFCRQSGDRNREPGVLSTLVGFHFSAIGSESSTGFGVIDTAWDQGRNYKCTTLCYGHSGWRVEADHSSQTVTVWDNENQPMRIAQFLGNRLHNHYLGVFANYRKLYEARDYAMNSNAARRIHTQLFNGMNMQ